MPFGVPVGRLPRTSGLVTVIVKIFLALFHARGTRILGH